jgi:hypothetical protein
LCSYKISRNIDKVPVRQTIGYIHTYTLMAILNE